MKSFKNSFLMLLVLTVGVFDVKMTWTEGEFEENFTTVRDQTPSDDEMKEYARKLNEEKYSLSKEEQRSIAHKMLGLDPAKQYTENEIKVTRNKALLKWHPDKNQDPEAANETKALNSGKDILENTDFNNFNNFNTDEWEDVKTEPVDLHQKLISGLNDSVREKLNNDTIKNKINDIFNSLTDTQKEDFINSLNKLEDQQPNSSIETLINKAEDAAKFDLNLSAIDRAKNWWKKKTFKSFTEIFKSDKTILKEYLQKAVNHLDPELKINTDTVKNAVAKLSRTERMDLFNDITHEELDQARTSERRDALFTRNEKLFKQLLPKHEMLVTTTDANNSIVSTNFKIINMRQVDPNLSLAENAKIIEKAQDLNYNVKDLEKNIRKYLQDNPSPQNLKTLLVDATDRTRTMTTSQKAETIENIFTPDMKKSFDTLSATAKDQFITDITKAELRLKETNMNLAGRGAKVSYEEAKRIFQENATIFEKIVGPDKILVPIESESRNNASSFKFETIDISRYKNNIKAIFENQDKETPLFKAYKAQNPSSTLSPLDFDLIDVAKQLKSKQNLKLSISDIVAEIKRYSARQ